MKQPKQKVLVYSRSQITFKEKGQAIEKTLGPKIFKGTLPTFYKEKGKDSKIM